MTATRPTSLSAFAELGVPTSLAGVLATRGITVPTPIQAATLPDALAGRDVLGRGRTGSGKTFAFLLPLVTRLSAARTSTTSKRPRALILVPTRELAAQIEESLVPLQQAARLTSTTIFGGVRENPQIAALRRGVDVVVACPGRLLALVRDGHLSLGSIEITVVDEADQMADMGFLPTVRKILEQTPKRGQRMLFSATLDTGVDVLVKQFLHGPVVHQADSPEDTIETMEHHVLKVSNDERTGVLVDLAASPGRTILFTRTKHGAKKLTKQLIQRGIPAVELHGNLSQNARTRNLAAFETGRVEALVATDIAARGIHVDDVALVVHADPPVEAKAYLHRSGRTARAGKSGTVVTIATPEQGQEVRSLMRAAKIVSRVTSVREDAGVLQLVAPGQRRMLSPDEAHRVANPHATAPDASVRPPSGAGRGARPVGRRNGSPQRGSDAAASHRARPAGNGGRGFNGARAGNGGRGGSGAASFSSGQRSRTR